MISESLAMYGIPPEAWEPEELAPAEPIPDLPAEVWHTREFDPQTAHEATVALCRAA